MHVLYSGTLVGDHISNKTTSPNNLKTIQLSPMSD